MPLPKGINRPEVRAAWLAERREKVAAFDRLVATGLPEGQAARTLGTTRPGINAMRRSVEAMEDGHAAGRACGAHIDLGLAILACLLLPGEHLTAEDISCWCGCSKSAIQSIERRALAKVRQRLVDEIGEVAVAEEVDSLLAIFSAAA